MLYGYIEKASENYQNSNCKQYFLQIYKCKLHLVTTRILSFANLNLNYAFVYHSWTICEWSIDSIKEASLFL